MLRIIEYPHPTLRHVSKPLKRVDAELHAHIRQMFELMYEAKGIGLAANQVDLPYRLFVVNLEASPDSPETELVFINPVIRQRKGSEEAEEGCLSIPGLYAPVTRPKSVIISAYNDKGEELTYELDGLPARVVQHETDHLDGVLFIDKLGPTGQMSVRDQLDEFEIQYSQRRSSGQVPDDESIAARLAELESLRC